MGHTKKNIFLKIPTEYFVQLNIYSQIRYYRDVLKKREQKKSSDKR